MVAASIFYAATCWVPTPSTSVGISAPPPNDNIAGAMPIASLPFTHSVSNEYATTEWPYDPFICRQGKRTVWYTFTAPSDMNIQADTSGSNHASTLTVYSGDGPSDLHPLACDTSDDRRPDPRVAIAEINVSAGTQLFFQVDSHLFGCCGLTLNVFEGEGPPGAPDCSDGQDNESDGASDGADIGCLPRPPNDDFAGSRQISLPFFTSLDMRTASIERGEPNICDSYRYTAVTAWYSFTPATDMHVYVDTFHQNWGYWTNNYDSILRVYTGSSFAEMVQVGCAEHHGIYNQGFERFVATAGTTYHIQLGGKFNQTESETAELFIRQYDPATDMDGDGWADSTELACGSDPVEPQSRPERLDTWANDDYWDELNEPLPAGAGPHDCDGDGYTGQREAAIGTSDQDPCGTTGWPSDLVVGFQPNALNIEDLGSFLVPVRRFNTSPGHPNFDQRWNLSPAPSIGGAINASDVAAVVTGGTGYPLMFSGLRAYGRECRSPPDGTN